MICPHCGKPATQAETGNDGVLYVAEDLYGSTEIYDGDIKMFHCSSGNPTHVFYTESPEERS